MKTPKSANIKMCVFSQKTNHQVLKQALAVVQDKLSTNISQAWQDISDLLWSWHNYVRDKYPIISDHALYRSLNGIISCVPDEIERNDDLLKFVFSELLNEYSPFISRYQPYSSHRFLKQMSFLIRYVMAMAMPFKIFEGFQLR